MRKSRRLSLISMAAIAATAKLAEGQVKLGPPSVSWLFATQADFGGSSYAPNPPPAGQPLQTGWQGFSSYPDPIAISSASTDSATTDGIGNLDNTVGDADAGTSWAGWTSPSGSMVLPSFTGGVDTISTGNMIVDSSGTINESLASQNFVNALTGGTCLAFDITAPGGGTTLPATNYQATFETADPNPSNAANSGNNEGGVGFNNKGFMLSNFAATLANKDTNLAGPATNYSVGNDDPGTFTITHGSGPGSYWTVYLPYAFAPNYAATLSYLQFALALNSGGGIDGNVTIDDIRTVSPTWAAAGNGSWNSQGIVNYNDPQPGGGITSNGVLTQQGNWVGAGANSVGQYGYGVPNGSGVSATFGDLETSNAAVFLESAQTVGTLNFDTLNYQYTLTPQNGGKLIMDNTANVTAATAFINVTAAGTAATNYTEIIAVPMQLNETTNVTVARSTDVLAITGNISGPGGLLSVAGGGTLRLSGTNSYSGGTTWGGAGTLQVTTANSLPENKPVTVLGGLVELTSSLAGTGTMNLSELTIETLGKFRIDTNATLGSQSSPTPASNVNITSLSITGNGTLDINNNHIIIDYTPGNDPIASIVAWIDSGANVIGGVPTWTGTGITSTAAAANAGSYGIGYADVADPGNPAHLAAGQIEVMYMLLGDANLDGKVNGTDFNILAANFNTGGDSWDQGDFTYDGKVNGSDFNLLAANFNQGATQSADFAALDSFAAANGISVNVPEPGVVVLLTVGVAGVLSRRRRI